MTRKHLLASLVITLWYAGSIGMAAPQEVLESFEGQMRHILTEAGYKHDNQASLVRAVTDSDGLVATVAAHFLSRHPATPQAISALRIASESPDEGVVVAAAQSLQLFGASGWEESAIARLKDMKYPGGRLQLSGVLAKAGRSEGWPVVKAALTSDSASMVLAVREVANFDGLRTADGGRIDAAAEIERIRDQAQGDPSKLYEIDAGVRRVHARRQAPPRKGDK